VRRGSVNLRLDVAANENEEQKQDLVPPLYRGFTPPGLIFFPEVMGDPTTPKTPSLDVRREDTAK
jgi:hypothetical protein